MTARAGIRAADDAVVVEGVVDFDSVPALVASARRLGAERFHAVDTAAVTKIDSAGVAFLLWIKKHYGQPERPFEIRAAPDQVSRMLSVTGLDNLLG